VNEIAPAWFEHSAMGDLLGENIALVQPKICIVAWTSSPA